MLIELSEVTSTNDYLKQHRQELSDGTAVTALRQTAGRGRRGRAWLTSDGMLPLSILLKSPPHPTELTLCAAVAVCEVLEEYCGGHELGIKWPNDIVLDSRKLCGILCESVFFGDRCEIICGIGINLTQTEEYFREVGLPHAASLKTLIGAAPYRAELAEMLAQRVIQRSKSSFFGIYDDYRTRCVTLGKDVKLTENGRERIAVAIDIAPNGYLICRDESGEFTVNSGEVSVRGLYGYV